MRSEIVRVGVSIACLFLVFYYFPVTELLDTVKSVDIASIAIAFILLTLNILLSSVRFFGMSRSFKINITYRIAHHLNILSQIAGLFLFQTLGQTIFRSAYGLLYVPNAQRFALLTFLEKITAFAILIVMGTVGALIVYQQIGATTGTIQYLSILFICMLISGFAIWKYGLTASQQRYLRFGLRQIFKLGIGRAAVISLFAHLCMLGAYLAIVTPMLPDVDGQILLGVFLIVMLGAAIPISFAGWGIRELSASIVFSFLALDPIIGVSASAIIGVLSLIALLTQGGVSILFTPEKPVQTKEENLETRFKFERIFAFICSLFICLLIGFQVKVPTVGGGITANLADPLTVVLAITFIVFLIKSKIKESIWRVKYINYALLAFAAMIAIGWFHSFFTGGSNSWADNNRSLGLIIVFSYFFTGTMLTGLFGARFKFFVVKQIFISTVAIYIFYLLVVPYFSIELWPDFRWSLRQFAGLIGNRNAMAFILMILVIIYLYKGHLQNPLKNTLIISTLCLFTMQTGSLTGVVTVLCAILISRYGQQISTKKLIYVTLITSSLFVLQYILQYIQVYLPQLISDSISTKGTGNLARYYFDYYDRKFEGEQELLRLDMLKQAFQLWEDNPIFGAGLGRFLDQSGGLSEWGRIIHNSLLWILAEMGIVGLLLFLTLPAVLLRSIFTKEFSPDPSERLTLFIFIFSVALFSMAHEILYQRALWFFLGLLVARPLQRPLFDRQRNDLSLGKNGK